MPRISKQERVSHSEAARRRIVAMAELRELQTAKLRGELLDRIEAVREWAETCARLRDRLLMIPERTAAALSGRPEAEIRATLRNEIEDALRSLVS